MKNNKCLVCYKILDNDEVDFHPRCSKRLFGTSSPPVIPYSINQMYELANEVIRNSVAVPGVQAKLSMDIESYRETKKEYRFTIVGLWGGYVLKPPSEQYSHLPEIEDATMHLAEIAKIRTVPHSLIRLKSGELAYVTKRIDRMKDRKLAMEDMCQLSGRLTEDKYKGSIEQIGKIVQTYSSHPGLDLIELFEVTIFSFLTGNADMHLKNFSLIRQSHSSITLSPAYDLVSTKLAIPQDTEETALTINGKKRNLNINDFIALGKNFSLNERSVQNSLGSLKVNIPKFFEFIELSFLIDTLKKDYKQLIEDRAGSIDLL